MYIISPLLKLCQCNANQICPFCLILAAVVLIFLSFVLGYFIYKRKKGKPIPTSEFQDAVNTLKDKLEKDLKNDKLNRDKWLRKLYDNYNQRFLSDNSKIWISGSILIPLSLSPLVILANIDNPQTIHKWVFFLISSVILLFWLWIAENHRAFQNKSMAWMVAIEETIGLETKEQIGAKIPDGRLNRFFAKQGAVRLATRFFCIMVLFIWLLFIIWFPRGKLVYKECPRKSYHRIPISLEIVNSHRGQR